MTELATKKTAKPRTRKTATIENEIIESPVIEHDQPVPVKLGSEFENIMSNVSYLLANQNVTADTIDKYLTFAERIHAFTAERAFAEAMNRTQAEIKTVEADTENTQIGKKYASHEQLEQSIKPIYTRHGFSIMYDTDPAIVNNVLVIKCWVKHAAGHKELYQMPIPITDSGIHGKKMMTDVHAAIGSVTYGRSCLIKMVFNIPVDKNTEKKQAEQNKSNNQKSPKIGKEHLKTLREKLTFLNRDENSDRFKGWLYNTMLTKVTKLEDLNENGFNVIMKELNRMVRDKEEKMSKGGQS